MQSVVRAFFIRSGFALVVVDPIIDFYHVSKVSIVSNDPECIFPCVGHNSSLQYFISNLCTIVRDIWGFTGVVASQLFDFFPEGVVIAIAVRCCFDYFFPECIFIYEKVFINKLPCYVYKSLWRVVCIPIEEILIILY